MDKKTYNFLEQEGHWRDFWEKKGIYKFDPKKKGPIFSIDTPPPTVSGKMHVGHAFSYTHEDIIARYHRMKGENVFYPFGTDDNGLATEKLVEKENKVQIFQMDRSEFVALCQKTLKRILPDFVQDWKNIGMSCDFSLYYSTISKSVQALSQKFFLELYNKKRIYRKKAPTLWCPFCQTAIAQVELEDKQLKSVFSDIAFELEGGGRIAIATTRPELLPSCVAILVHPKSKKHKKFVGQTAIVPIFGQKVKIIADDNVDPNKGTGVVMCCTFGDTTDIEWYAKYKLPLKISIDQAGKMNELAGPYKGLAAKEARQKIIADLEKEGILSNKKDIEHAVNVHERCGTEVEIIDTVQWFIKYLDLKEDFLKMGRQIKWFPDYMQKRYENWVTGLRWDWCISRQRYFGIPFPLWYCKKCGEVKIADAADLPVDPLSSKPKTKCSCGSNQFVPEKDVLDTWVTSSLTPYIAIDLVDDKKVKAKLFPMSLRPQAHDIINFWLFYTVARSKLHFNKIPWDKVMISGFVLDPKGEKMSKSKGNVVAPQEMVQKYGADSLRHWAAKASPGDDFRWNEEEIKASKKTVTKLFNATRFCLMHLEKFKYDPKNNFKELAPEDGWILHLLRAAIKEYDKNFQENEIRKAREAVDNFFWKHFCDNYLEFIKHRLCQDTADKSAQQTLYICLLFIIKMYAPVMPFITEDIYQDYFKKFEKEESIHLSLLPEESGIPALSNGALDGFNKAAELISEIRRYKTQHGISLKQEIEEYKTKISVDKKYIDFVKKVTNVESIK